MTNHSERFDEALGKAMAAAAEATSGKRPDYRTASATCATMYLTLAQLEHTMAEKDRATARWSRVNRRLRAIEATLGLEEAKPTPAEAETERDYADVFAGDDE